MVLGFFCFEVEQRGAVGGAESKLSKSAEEEFSVGVCIH